jgi:hypothetical protein
VFPLASSALDLSDVTATPQSRGDAGSGNACPFMPRPETVDLTVGLRNARRIKSLLPQIGAAPHHLGRGPPSSAAARRVPRASERDPISFAASRMRARGRRQVRFSRCFAALGWIRKNARMKFRISETDNPIVATSAGESACADAASQKWQNRVRGSEHVNLSRCRS